MTLSLPSIIRFLVRSVSLLLLLIGASLLTQAQSIRYVKTVATGAGNGSSWANASGNLQAMINASAAMDQVWVAAGTYKPGGNANTERTISFTMKDGVVIYGGFAGSETSLSQRPAVNLITPSTTTLSGDIGTAGNTDNSYHVISNPPGLTTSAVLDGFVITGGNANGGSDPDNEGGGMYNNGRNAVQGCSPLIRNCTFQGNSATLGGAIYNDESLSGTNSPVLTNCAFQGNSARFAGGGIYNANSNPSLTNCSFLGNSASLGLGGAILNDGNGGTSSPVLTNCSFQANSATTSGGAIYNSGSSSGTSSPMLTNCVLFGNGGSNSITNNNASVSVTYSLLETGITGYSNGGNNLTTTVSPFVSPTDTRLNGCSPAINRGSNAAYTTANGDMPPNTDLAGNARLFPSGGQIDMGAYEYQAASTVNFPPPSVNTTMAAAPFSQSFVASGGSSPYTYSLATGSLPTGLNLATTGVLSGIPTQGGSFTFTVMGRDATGCSGVSGAYVLTVRSDRPIRYVKVGGTGSGNSWADASGDLQSQIDFIAAEQVWVAAGTYKPTTGTDRTISFAMRPGVAIYGGFVGSETSLSQRPAVNLTTPSSTTLSGDIDNSPADNGGNSCHVIRNRGGLTTSAVLDGFVITGGNADAGDYIFRGGGMLNSGDSPTVRNCSFQGNSADVDGGAIYNDDSSPVLTNCSFQANSASGQGGAIYNDGSSPVLTNCSFQSNSAAIYGGAICNDNTSKPTLTNCSLLSNSASQLGGAIFNRSSSTTLTNCSLQSNNAPNGGAIANVNGSNSTLINCSLRSNSASQNGGAIYNDGGSVNLTNCVVWGNGGATTFNNQQSNSITTNYSLFDPSVTGYNAGTGNITTPVSPFLSPTDAWLNPCAPAINTGNNGANTTATDLAGNPRVFPSGGTGTPDRIDMGAYEYQAAPGQTPTVAIPSVSTATVGVTFSQNFTASGGTSPYSYSLASSISYSQVNNQVIRGLPPGLNLATTGVLSGTPTQAGSFTITALATPATGCPGLSAPYVLTVVPASPIRYVRAGASGSGNSWADASGDLQSQINFNGAEQVWVAMGTYKPTTTNDRTVSFSMKNGVPIYGGFAGTETALSQRVLSDPLATILSGDIGTAGDNADNSYHVINNPPGLNSSAVLDGFLITGGNANGNSPDDSGGGMINNGNGAGNTCSPLIRNCLFQNNRADNGGGAIHNAGYTNGNSNPSLINCAFQSNTAAVRGGAIHNDGSVGGNSNPSLINCSFQANSAPSGGAIYNIAFQGNSRPALTNCVVWGNGGAGTFNNQQGAFITTSYNLFESSVTGYSPGTDNLTTTTSPFANTTTTLLRCGSAAINAGDPTTTSATVGPIDLAGMPRFFNNGRIDMGAYEIQGTSAIIPSPPVVNTATVGIAFSQNFTTSGGTSPYNYNLASGSLPSGLSLSTTGVVSGTPTQNGSFTLTVRGQDATGCSGVSAPYVLTVTNAANPNPTLAGFTASSGMVCVGSPVAFTATVGNLTGSYSYTLTNGLSASLTGTATTSPFSQSITASGTGTQNFTLMVSANGQSVSSITALTVNPSPVASLTNNGPLSCAQSSVTLTAGGGSSYTFANGSGVLGTPGLINTLVVSTEGTYSVTVASASGCSATAQTTVTVDQTAPTATISGNLTVTMGGSTTLTASGGTNQVWSTGQTTPSIVVMAGTYSVTVTKTSGCSSSTSVTVTTGNSAPVATANANQTAIVGVPFAYTVSAFTDAETPNQLTYSASISPANGFSFDPATRIISGTPSMSGVSSVTVRATDPGNLSASTGFTITVSPAPVTPPPTTPTFSITGVTTASCQVVSAGQRRVTFTPRYEGLDGSPVRFRVVNETLPTTGPGPYTLTLYTDNPVITLEAVQSGVASQFRYGWLAACNGTTPPANTQPSVANPVPPQSATVGTAYTLSLAGVFTDAETPNQLTLSVSDLPAEITFTPPATISGTPSVSGVSNVTVTATDPGGLTVSHTFTLTVNPAGGTPLPPSGTFSLTGVTTVSCQVVSAGQRRVTFTPRYEGLDGSPVRFRVVNETLPTTGPGPYTLTLYTDNPVITLKATQTGSAGEASFAYNWLAACATQGQDNTPPRVNQPVASQTATVGQAFNLSLASTFADQETPNQLSLRAAGLPAGLSLSGSTISGTASASGVSSVTITATDPGNLSVSTSFTITVVPASVQPPTPPVTASFSLTGVTTVSCEVVSAGQRRVTFTPRYSGLDDSPVNFSVVNEKLPTTDAGPYSLNLYTDNPVITLSARQSGVSSSFAYDWRAACTPTARVGAGEAGSGLQVIVLGNPVKGETVSVEVRGADGQALTLSVVDARGHRVVEQSVGRAGVVERQSLRLGQSPAGVLLLRVSTSTQSQTVKLLKVE